ncbi:MAG: exo-alpha-sialidase [Planctomycetales bacterium]|nr:exo-alpha-sialidase [Planctomycetales bacterium]
MIEPTIAETSDGRVAMVMRGSNSHDAEIPARKWISVSDDHGETWADAKAWGCSDGSSFFSPSSMSLLTRHSSGRLFWVGHLTPENASGNLPRYPAVIGELDPESRCLIRSSVVTLDEQSAEDRQKGRLDLSHFDPLEDRPSGDLILTYPRSHQSYQSREFAELRLKLSPNYTARAVRKPSQQFAPDSKGSPSGDPQLFLGTLDRLIDQLSSFTASKIGCWIGR